jgi:SSS family solute:Na+ symporter
MALFLPGRIGKKYAVWSMIVGPVFVLAGKFILPATIDPLFLGVGISLLILIIGLFVNNKAVTDSSKRSII